MRGRRFAGGLALVKGAKSMLAMKSRTWLPALAVAMAVGCLSFASPAQADSVECLFSGVADLDPPIRRAPLLSGDSTYNLTADGDCEYIDTTGPGAGTAYETRLVINSSGLYRNDICLTGWIVSNWDNPLRPGTTSVNFEAANATDITSMRYLGRLTAGTGDIAIKAVNDAPDSVGDGWLVTLPRFGSCTEPPGVYSLDVLGQFAASL